MKLLLCVLLVMLGFVVSVVGVVEVMFDLLFDEVVCKVFFESLNVQVVFSQICVEEVNCDWFEVGCYEWNVCYGSQQCKIYLIIVDNQSYYEWNVILECLFCLFGKAVLDVELGVKGIELVQIVLGDMCYEVGWVFLYVWFVWLKESVLVQ